MAARVVIRRCAEAIRRRRATIPTVALEQRFVTDFATEGDQEPGLVLAQDGTVWLVRTSGGRIPLPFDDAVIPDLSDAYAPLTGGKIDASVLPDLSSLYAPLVAGKVPRSLLPSISADDLPDLSQIYARLESGKVLLSAVPDLSSLYAALHGGRVFESVIPDLSARYAPVGLGGKISHSALPTLVVGDIPDLSASYAAVSGGKIAHSALPALQVDDVPDLSATYRTVTNTVFALGSGGKLQVKDHAGNSVFELRDDGTLHVKVGVLLSADL